MEGFSESTGEDRRAPSTEDEAQQILDKICAEKGYKSPEIEADMATLSARASQWMDMVQTNYRKEQSKSTSKLAEELYSSKFRLIYELLQNADDAEHDHYPEPAIVIFRISPAKMVVDTNEVGFTIANVRAICRTGESSKIAPGQGRQIGEKGYGFKSVFAVACHVRIQSGFWSFYFEHHEGQDGLGMITPLRISPESLPEGITTRITLTFIQEPANIFTQLVDEMEALPDTVTMFLQTIKELEFSVTKPASQKVSTTIRADVRAVYPNGRRSVVTTKTTTKHQANTTVVTSKEQKYYTIFTRLVREMPTDKRRSGINESEVQLAFRIDAQSRTPVVDPDGQYVFSFLPMHKVAQIPFHIQADFITLASRESVVDCSWNQRLRDAVAQTFSLAMQSFYDDGGLQFVWMRYWPLPHISGFWQPLRQKCASHLKSLRLFKSWKSGSAARISELRIVPARFLHESVPLIEDLQNEIYLAPEYQPRDLLLLRELGLEEMTARDFLCRLRYDLDGILSRVRTTPPDDTWHTSLSATLLAILETSDETLTSEVRRLELIPLRRELQLGESFADMNRRQGPSWISAQSIKFGGAYFPYTTVKLTSGDFLDDVESIPLPNGLEPLSQVIWPSAVVCPKRKALFSRLGARPASSEIVIGKLFLFNQFLGDRNLAPNLETVISQLRYVFWFYNLETPLSRKHVFLFTDQKSYFSIGRCPAYLKSDVKYGAWELLKDTAGNIRKGVAHFLDDKITMAESERAVRYHRSWNDWLYSEVGIKIIPPLMEPGVPTQLGNILLHVLDTQPAKFIHILHEHWETSYKAEAREHPGIKRLIKVAKIPCENGMESRLCETLLPSETLKRETDRIGITKHMPFLDVSMNHKLSSVTDWEFLTVFEVTKDIALKFFTHSLDVIRKLQVDAMAIHQMVSEVYKSIGHICSRELTNEVRQVFETQSRIYANKDKANPWRKPEDCVWEAPPFLTVKAPLGRQYGDNPDIRSLFHLHLGIRNADHRDYLEQLSNFKNSTTTGVIPGDCLQVYRKILADGELGQETHWDEIRQKFELDRLIWANGSWFPPSQCLWTSGVSISDKVTIASSYSGLESFFIDRLRVQTADTAMIIDELAKRMAATELPATEEVKKIIKEISRMMRTETPSDNLRRHLQRLKKVKFLPISKNLGRVNFEDAFADFVIVDHERYGEAYRPVAACLDFSLDEVQVLFPLISALRLNGRYLSQKVTERSEIVGKPTRDHDLTAELQLRAYSLYCCAVKFKSSKVLDQDISLHLKLQSVTVLETDGIRTSMILLQNGKRIKVPSLKIQLKFEDADELSLPKKTTDAAASRRDRTTTDDGNYDAESERGSEEDEDQQNENELVSRSELPEESPDDEDAWEGFSNETDAVAQHEPSGQRGNSSSLDSPKLRLFVPASRKERQACYRSQLPGELTRILGISDGRALLPISQLLNLRQMNCSELDILQEQDIPQISWISPPATFRQSPLLAPSNAPEPVSEPSYTPSSVRESSTAPSETSRTFTPFSDQSTLPVNFSAGQGRVYQPLQQVTQVPRRNQRATYLQLLDSIVKKVSILHGETTDGGESGRWDLTGLRDALPEAVSIPRQFDKDETFGIRSENQLAHDMRIGAAGELYVFEMLRRMDPQGFVRNNWESSIRHLVTDQSDYADMTRQTHTEDADILYVDTNGKFLAWLQQQDTRGLLDWLSQPTGQPRKYYIEVKTTTLDCNAIFHMSTPQFQRMEQMRRQPLLYPKDVYVICRVYNLLSDNISMRFYVSPGRNMWEKDHILEFASKGYEVRPAGSVRAS